jgi:MFS family permease
MSLGASSSPRAITPSSQSSNRAAWFLGPVLALALLPSNVVATALPLLQTEWRASAAEMGVVFAAYQVGYVAAVLLVLPLTDRVPAGRVIAVCATATGLSFVAFPLMAFDVVSASLLRALSGIGLAGVYMPGARVVSAASSAERRGLAVSGYVSSFYLGAAISLWATGVLLPLGGWRHAALVLGVISVAALPLAVLGTRGVPSPQGNTSRLRLSPLKQGPVLRTILAYTGHSWELYVSRGWLAAYLATVLSARGIGPVESAAQGGQLSALMAGLGTVGVWLGGHFSDRWGRARAALAIALTSGLISLGFGWLGGVSWELLLIVGCLYGLLVAADSGIYTTSVTELAPEDQIGSAQAAQAFLGFTATALAPIAAGLVLDAGGGFGGAFFLAGVVGLVGAAALAPLAASRVSRPASRVSAA